MRQLHMHSRDLPPLRSLARHPREKHLLWSSHRGQHGLWDVERGELVQARAGDEGALLIGGGQWLITAGDGAAVVRDLEGGTVVHREGVPNISGAVLCETDAGDAFVAGDAFGAMVRVEYGTWKATPGWLARPEVKTIAVEKDPEDREHLPPIDQPIVKIGRLLRAGPKDMLSWRVDLGCLTWIDTSDPAASGRRIAELHGAKIDAAALDTEGSRCVLACNDGSFAFAGLTGGEIQRHRLRGAEAVTARMIGNYPPVRQLAWSGTNDLWWLTPGWLYHADLLAQRTRGLRLQSSALCILPLPEHLACAVGAMDGNLRIVEIAEMPVVHGA